MWLGLSMAVRFGFGAGQSRLTGALVGHACNIHDLPAWHEHACSSCVARAPPCPSRPRQPLVFCVLEKVESGTASWGKATDVLELAFQSEPDALLLR